MKTLAGLFLIIWDGLGKMIKGMFNIFNETPISIIFLTSILTVIFLALWINLSWLASALIMIVIYAIIGISGDIKNRGWSGAGVWLAALIAIALSIGAGMQLMHQTPAKELITS